MALVGIKRSLSIFSARANPPLHVADPLEYVRLSTFVTPEANNNRI